MVNIMTNIEPELKKLSKNAKRGGKPPVGFTPRPGQVVCNDIGMHIDSRGLWHYQGSPINRIELVKLFSTVLRRDENDDHWLITPAEMCKIDVIDAPFLAVELICTDTGTNQSIDFRTNIDQRFTLNEEHPLRIDIDQDTNAPAPYIALDHGLEAKLSRAVFYELVDLGKNEDINGEQIYGVWSSGHFFPIDATP
jgi:hypothetical protein